MVITIEPVVGFKSCKGRIVELPDGWSVKTIDNSWTAQFEHTIHITSEKADILTQKFPE